MRFSCIAATAGLAIVPAVLAAFPALAQPVNLAGHRAVYELSLKEASERSGITAMNGRMVFETNGSPCEGYTVSFRFVTDVATGEDSRITDQQVTTYEDVKNRTFTFVNRSYVNQQLDREVRGSAEAEKDGVKVTLEGKDGRALDLSAALFPTQQMLELIEKARQGEQIYESAVFDGSDGGDQVMITTTILGRKQEPKKDDPELAKADPLKDLPFWPVSMSYFEESVEGDGLPVYSVSFKMYENGITRDLVMDYGDFSLTGQLSNLEVFKPADCPQ